MDSNKHTRKSRGGRTSHVVRVPLDLSIDEINHYYTVIKPAIEFYQENKGTSPRWERLNQFLEQIAY